MKARQARTGPAGPVVELRGVVVTVPVGLAARLARAGLRLDAGLVNLALAELAERHERGTVGHQTGHPAT